MRPFVLAAGGTGGHRIPAEALAGELIARGRVVHLLSDARADAFAGPLAGTPDPSGARRPVRRRTNRQRQGVG